MGMVGLVKNKESMVSKDLKFLELDLSNWEFVSTFDLDRDDDGGVESWSSGCSIGEGDENCGGEKLEATKCIDHGEESKKKKKQHEEAYEDAAADNVVSDECEVGDSDDDGEEGAEDDDLDDELVPRSVSARFGRQRMRKLGSRSFAKMAKSKRASLLYSRPGCVHGKHGLGLKYII